MDFVFVGTSGGGGGGGITQLTGEVTAGPGSGSQAATIANDSVTNAKLANMAQATAKGRAAGAGTGDPTDLTQAQLTELINAFTSLLSGAVPASGGGTVNFLRADGTWAAPAANDTITGSQAAPVLVTAAGGITPAGVRKQTIFIAGNGGPITVTASPQIAAGTTVGDTLKLIGTNNTDTVTFTTSAGLDINSPRALGRTWALGLTWNGSEWGEDFYSER